VAEADAVEVDFLDAGAAGGGGDAGLRTDRCGLALLSVGYEGGAAAAAPGGARPVCVGWAKGTGKGIIGDNMWDAEAVVAALTDAQLGLDARGGGGGGGGGGGDGGDGDGIDDWIRASGRQVVDWDGWERIDAEERRRGKALHPDRERVKIETFEEMLAIAG
jgi:hypothetical protein